MPDWAIALIGLFGVIIGALITFLIHWLERKERYQILAFPKRLEAHQQALSFCLEITSTVQFLTTLISANKEKVNELLDSCEKADDWWRNNLLYLDERSRSSMISGLLSAYKYGLRAKEDTSKNTKDTWRLPNSSVKDSNSTEDGLSSITKLQYAIECIIKGIGAKYLPEMKKLESLKHR